MSTAETKTLPEDETIQASQDSPDEDGNLSDIDSHNGSERDAVSEAGSETPSVSDKSSARNSRSASNTPTNTRSTRSRDNPEFVAKQKSFMAKVQAATAGVDCPMARPDTPGKRKRESSASSTQISSKKRKSGKVDNNGQDYQNDNYCWECHREGVFICCEMCPRVFHLKCAGMEKEPEEDWACSECHAVMQAENIENRSRAMQLISVEQLCTLLKFALNRLKTMPGMEPFTKPVDTTEFPTYDDVVVHAVDFISLERNIKRKFYGSTEAFSSDARWIVHNSVIFNGANSKVTSMARSLVKILKQDMSEIETCPDCYMNAHQKPNSWFTEACRSAHPLIWARLKGFPFWPAKAVKWKDGNVDVRFFGRHDRSWVPVKECFLFSEQMPTPLKNRNKTLESCLQEVNDHIIKLRERFGKFKYAPHRIQFNPLDQDQIKIMLPNYKGPAPLRVRAQSRAISRLSAQSDDETSSIASTDSGSSSRRRKRESGTSSATQETETEEFPSQSSAQEEDDRPEDSSAVKYERDGKTLSVKKLKPDDSTSSKRIGDSALWKFDEREDHSYSKPKYQETKIQPVSESIFNSKVVEAKSCEDKVSSKIELDKALDKDELDKLSSKDELNEELQDSDEEMEFEGYPTGNYDEEDALNLLNGEDRKVDSELKLTSNNSKLVRVRSEDKEEQQAIGVEIDTTGAEKRQKNVEINEHLTTRKVEDDTTAAKETLPLKIDDGRIDAKEAVVEKAKAIITTKKSDFLSATKETDHLRTDEISAGKEASALKAVVAAKETSCLKVEEDLITPRESVLQKGKEDTTVAKETLRTKSEDVSTARKEAVSRKAVDYSTAEKEGVLQKVEQITGKEADSDSDDLDDNLSGKGLEVDLSEDEEEEELERLHLSTTGGEDALDEDDNIEKESQYLETEKEENSTDMWLSEKILSVESKFKLGEGQMSLSKMSILSESKVVAKDGNDSQSLKNIKNDTVSLSISLQKATELASISNINFEEAIKEQVEANKQMSVKNFGDCEKQVHEEYQKQVTEKNTEEEKGEANTKQIDQKMQVEEKRDMNKGGEKKEVNMEEGGEKREVDMKKGEKREVDMEESVEKRQLGMKEGVEKDRVAEKREVNIPMNKQMGEKDQVNEYKEVDINKPVDSMDLMMENDSDSDKEDSESDLESKSEKDLQNLLVEKVTSYPGIVLKKLTESASSSQTDSDKITLMAERDTCGNSSLATKVDELGYLNLLKDDSNLKTKMDDISKTKTEDSSHLNVGTDGNDNSLLKSRIHSDVDNDSTIESHLAKVDRLARILLESKSGDEERNSNDYAPSKPWERSDSGSYDSDENRLQIDKIDNEKESDKESPGVGSREPIKESDKNEKENNSFLERSTGMASTSEEIDKNLLEKLTSLANASEEEDGESETELERIKREFANKMGISITLKDKEKISKPFNQIESMDVDNDNSRSEKDSSMDADEAKTEKKMEASLGDSKQVDKPQESNNNNKMDETARDALYDAVQLMKNMGTVAITKLDNSSDRDSRTEGSVSISVAKDLLKSESKSDEKIDVRDDSSRPNLDLERLSTNKSVEQQISALGCSVSVTKAPDKEKDKERDKEKDKERDKEKEKSKERVKEKEKESEKDRGETDKEKAVKMPTGVDTTRLSPSISIIAVSGAGERLRAKTTVAPSASPNTSRNSPTPSGQSAPRSSASVSAQNTNESSSASHSSNPPRVSSASSSSSPHIAHAGAVSGIPPPPPLSHPQSSSANTSSRGVFGPPPPGNQVLGNRAPIINSPNLRMMSGPGPGIMFPNRLPGMTPSRHLPPEAGPLATTLHKHSQKLAEVMRATLEDVLGGLVGTGTPEARLAALQLELERTSWRHQQELAEVRHNADVMLVEMRANLEAEKQRAVEEVKRQMEQQLVDLKRQMDRQMGERLSEAKRQMEAEKQRAVEETKKKQWCASCGKEALFFCCWNTSYCDYPCQQSHWPQHMTVCGQNSEGGGGHGGGEGGSDSVNGEASAQSSRVSTPVQNLVAAQHLAEEEGAAAAAAALAEELRRRKHRENHSPYGDMSMIGRGSPAVSGNMSGNTSVPAVSPNLAGLPPGSRGATMATLGGPAMAAMAAMAAAGSNAAQGVHSAAQGVHSAAQGVHSAAHSNMKMHRYMAPNIMQQQQMYGGVDPRMMMMMGRGMPHGAAAAAAMMRNPMHHFRPRYM